MANDKTKDDIRNHSYHRDYNKFYEIYSNRLLPLIGVYNEAENSIDFFGSKVITEEYNNMSLDLLSYSHNSPAEILLSGDAIGLYGIAVSLYIYYKTKIENQKKYSFEDFERFIDYMDIENNDEIRYVLKNLYNDTQALYDTGNLNSLDIKSKFLSDKINDMFLKSDEIFEDELHNMGFKINDKRNFKIVKLRNTFPK